MCYSDVPNVVISITEELAENVNGHHAQPAVRLNLQDGQYRLVQNRISNVFRGVGVGRDLETRVSNLKAVHENERTCARISFMASLASASPCPR